MLEQTPLITLKADSAVDAYIHVLGDSFRSLCRKDVLQSNRKTVAKWSVEFTYNGHIVTTLFMDSAAAALKTAMDKVKSIMLKENET